MASSPPGSSSTNEACLANDALDGVFRRMRVEADVEGAGFADGVAVRVGDVAAEEGPPLAGEEAAEASRVEVRRCWVLLSGETPAFCLLLPGEDWAGCGRGAADEALLGG